MKALYVLPLSFALATSLVGCVASSDNQANDGGPLQNDSDPSGSGTLLISALQPFLSLDDQTSVSAAEQLAVRRELVIGGVRFESSTTGTEAPFFSHNNRFANNSTYPFELKFYGEFNGQTVELLSATGNHTFKSYEDFSCIPSRTYDCSDTQQSNSSSASKEQVLNFSAISLANCDGDAASNLQELFNQEDPCGGTSVEVQDEITVALLQSPSNDAVIERANSYDFRFSTNADTAHTAYRIDVLSANGGAQILGSSNRVFVQSGVAADYSTRVQISLNTGTSYLWQVQAISADGSERTISSTQSFKIANAVPVLSQGSPASNAVLEYVEADTGNVFSFSSTTDTGVSEYRVNLRDDSNGIDYGYKRLFSRNNAVGGDYSTTRNLALKPGARHSWYITAHAQSGTQLAITPTREFTVRSIAYNITQSSPAAGIQLEKVTSDVGYRFAFNTASNQQVAEYRVYLKNTTDGSDYGYKAITATTAVSYATTRNLDLAAGSDFEWYVTAVSADGDTLVSTPIRRFNLKPIEVDYTLRNVAPSNNAELTKVTADVGYVFTFNSSTNENISEYRVYVLEVGGSDYGYMAVSSSNAAEYSTTRRLNFTAGAQHRWYVTGVDANTTELVRSATYTFTVTAPDVQPPNFSNLSPANASRVPWVSGRVGYNFAFNVNNDDLVDSYRVHVRDPSAPEDFPYSEINAAANTTNDGVSSTMFLWTDSNVSHTWWVTAHDASGNELAKSDEQSFYIFRPSLVQDSPAADALVSLSGDGIDFIFSSDTELGVDEYRVYIRDDSDSSVNLGYSAFSTAIGNGQHSTVRRVALKENSPYSWRVASVDAEGFESASTEWSSFTTAP